MYNKEYYEANKEKYKQNNKKYRAKNKEKIRLYRKNYYQKNKKECNRKSMEYRAKNPKWKEYAKVCSNLHNNTLYPEEIPELEYYGCVSDLNYQIEKGGFIYGSKC